MVNRTNKSNGWRYLYLSLRFVHNIFLLCIYVMAIASGNLNTMKNLGYIFFFIVYMANESLYRNTGFVLSLFISTFIIG